MSDDNTGIESPILTIRIGEGLYFFGRSPKTNYKEPDLHSLQKKYNDFVFANSLSVIYINFIFTFQM